MPKTKLRHNRTSDTKEARLAAAESFTKGNRVRCRVTGKQGVCQEINLGFALPEVWVQFESDSEVLVPTSCNPLDLELVPENRREHPTSTELAIQGSDDLQAELDENTSQVPSGTCENLLLVENKLNSARLPSAVDVLPPVMTEVEARQCLQEIKHLFDAARAKLLEFKERRGWEAMNYPHLTACLEDYFPESRTKLVRELFAAEVERDILQLPIGTCPASHFRPLRKLKPQQYKQALDKAYALAGDGRLKSIYVADAVNQLLNPARSVNQNLPAKYKSGDLVHIKCVKGALPEQKAWNGCWGIVHSTGTISLVRVLVGRQEIEYMVGDLDWNDNLDPKFRDTCERILALWRKPQLEPVEENLLNFFQKRQFFSDLELKMIDLMENNAHFFE